MQGGLFNKQKEMRNAKSKKHCGKFFFYTSFRSKFSLVNIAGLQTLSVFESKHQSTKSLTSSFSDNSHLYLKKKKRNNSKANDFLTRASIVKVLVLM